MKSTEKRKRVYEINKRYISVSKSPERNVSPFKKILMDKKVNEES